MSDAVIVECSGRDNPRSGKTAHRTTPVALFMIDGVGQWTPVNDLLQTKELRHGRVTAKYRQDGDDRVSLRLADGTEVRRGEETITITCNMPTCGRSVQARARLWTTWLNECAADGVSLSISDGKFI